MSKAALRWRSATAMVVGATLVLGGCGLGGDGGRGGTAPGAEDDERSTVEVVVPSAPQPKGRRLSLEQRHPNGSVLRVADINFEPSSMTLAVEAVNGYTDKIRLNSQGIHLVDNLGNPYSFFEPEQNSDLEILPGGTLTGKLKFLGVVDRRATDLRLLVNAAADDTVDLTNRSDSSSSPQFQFDFRISR